jgi:hypothetical protein
MSSIFSTTSTIPYTKTLPSGVNRTSGVFLSQLISSSPLSGLSFILQIPVLSNRAGGHYIGATNQGMNVNVIRSNMGGLTFLTLLYVTPALARAKFCS